jgi:hypothetical protein
MHSYQTVSTVHKTSQLGQHTMMISFHDGCEDDLAVLEEVFVPAFVVVDLDFGFFAGAAAAFLVPDALTGLTRAGADSLLSAAIRSDASGGVGEDIVVMVRVDSLETNCRKGGSYRTCPFNLYPNIASHHVNTRRQLTRLNYAQPHGSTRSLISNLR